jgi:methylisocitrate lyase
MTELPAIIDADTGFGEPMNVARTIQTLEDAGLAGTHIEDQINPKRCGHLDGKAVVDESTATQRIRAAVDAGGSELPHHGAHRHPRRGGHGRRGRPGQGARRRGADAIFPEAMRTLAEFERWPPSSTCRSSRT